MLPTAVPGWEARFPWLSAGTTRRTPGAVDLPDSLAFAVGSGWRSVVRSRQVHGALTRVHTDVPAGSSVAGDGDGHATREPGVLLTVTLADCVPVFIVDPGRKAVALLHAGWRGVAAGVVESGFGVMAGTFGSTLSELVVHLGPAICGRCYEVGPEVFTALGKMSPGRPAPINLRGVIRRRAVASGIEGDQLSVSRECTLCGDGRYFSHRRGDQGRHRAFIGILPSTGYNAR